MGNGPAGHGGRPKARRRTAISVAVIVLYFVGYCAWLTFGWGGPVVMDVARPVGALLISVFSLVCAIAATRRLAGRSRIVWAAMALALAGWVFGDATQVVYRVIRGTEPPAFHIGDGGYLAMLLFVCLALLLLRRPVRGLPHQRAYAVLDAIVVFASLFIVAWVAVLRELAETHFDTSLHFLVAIAYPLFDVAVVTLAMSALMRSNAGHGRQVGLLAIGLMVIALANSGKLFLSVRNIDTRLALAGWMAGIILVGIAAMFWDRTGPRSAYDDPVRLPAVSLLLPYIPVTLSLVVAIAFFKNVDGAVPLLVAAGMLILSVLTRQYLVLVQNSRLLRAASEQALRDPLTGLANRERFRTSLDRALAQRASEGREVAVVLLDLDGFKQVNDNLGHLAGDTLLQQTADRLVASTSRADVVARLGGDEFAVLFGSTVTSSQSLAERIVTAFDDPFSVDGNTVIVRPSVGLAVADRQLMNGPITASGLMHQADTAMYAAKRSGAGGLVVFDGTASLGTTASDDDGTAVVADRAGDRMPSASK